MKTFFCSFGIGQYGGLLHDKYVEIEAPDEGAARKLMDEAFGRIWSALYYDNTHFWDLVLKHKWECLGVLK